MNKTVSNDTPLLTVGQVNQKRNELDEKLRQREMLNASIKQLEAWLEAVALLSGDDTTTLNQVEVDEIEDLVIHETENMADATKRILADSKRPLSHKQLQDALRLTPLFAERLEKNPNYYYTMISRLVKRSEIEKFRKLLRMPKTETAGT